MKATISSTGVLNITADNETEAYALAQWQKNSYIQIDDEKRNEKGHYKGSSIKVSLGKLCSNSICGMVVANGEIPFITGLDQHTKYKGVFVSDEGYRIAVDGISGEYGDIIPTTWDGVPKTGDVVKLEQN